MHSTPPSIFDIPQLETDLAGTIFSGKLHFAAVTDSTNTDALAAARAGAPHGSVYFADEQLAGRGRGDHAWHSAAGQGLYVSVLLRPSIPAVRLPLLPLAAGLAAAEAIRATTGLTVDLRWPNDLLIGPGKVGGILVEAGAGSKSLPYAVVGQPYAAVSLPHAVVGIGINVHQRSFAPGLATPATSLDLETERRAGKSASRQALLVALLKSLEDEALGLADPGSRERILRRVLGASTWMSGRSVQVHGPQGCTGVTAGLDANGFLLVETETGRVTVQTGGLRDATRA